MNPTQVGGLIRTLMAMLGGMGVISTYFTGETWTAITGVAVAAVTAGWSILSNKTTSMVKAVADTPQVKKVVMANASLADEVPSSKVVSPSNA